MSYFSYEEVGIKELGVSKNCLINCLLQFNEGLVFPLLIITSILVSMIKESQTHFFTLNHIRVVLIVI